MTFEQIEQIEKQCRIKSAEQFVEECQKNGISSEWYSFYRDSSKQVCFEGNSVYYNKYGVTNCLVPMTMWDLGFEKLLQYKKEYEWQQSGENFKIEKMVISNTECIAQKLDFPNVKLSKIVFEKDDSLQEDGWEFVGYNHYDAYYSYSKTVDIRTVLDKIKVIFTKKTSDEDKKEFGFTEEFIKGCVSYDVPKELIDELAHYEFDGIVSRSNYESRALSKELEEKVIAVLNTDICMDEFNALKALRDEHKKALFDAIDTSLTYNEQSKAWSNAANPVEFASPAHANWMGSRSYLVTNHNYELVHQTEAKR